MIVSESDVIRRSCFRAVTQMLNVTVTVNASFEMWSFLIQHAYRYLLCLQIDWKVQKLSESVQAIEQIVFLSNVCVDV